MNADEIKTMHTKSCRKRIFLRQNVFLGTTLSIALALAATLVFGAQEFPKTPPADLAISPSMSPKRESYTLKNGLKVIVAESRRTPLVTMQLVIKAGSTTEPAGSPGLAGAVASQLTAGTDKMTAYQLRVSAERFGGSVTASATPDYALISATGLGANAKGLTGILAEASLHPKFPAEELKVYQQLSLQGFIAQRQSPDFLANEQLLKAIYGESSPYGRASSSPAAIQALTPEKMKAFYQSRYSPEGAFLLVVGDVRASAILPIIEMQFGGWKVGVQAQRLPESKPLPMKGRKIYLYNRPGSVQSNILIGKTTLRRNDPGVYALTVANHVLGGSTSSRLFNSVREKKGYAYSVSSRLAYNSLTGTFTSSAQTRTAVTAPALKEMLAQMRMMSDVRVDETELESYKNNLVGNFAIGLTTQATTTTYLFNMEQYGLPEDWVESYRDRILAVRPVHAQRAAQSLLETENLAIVVVGDADQLRGSLKEIGQVIDVN